METLRCVCGSTGARVTTEGTEITEKTRFGVLGGWASSRRHEITKTRSREDFNWKRASCLRDFGKKLVGQKLNRNPRCTVRGGCVADVRRDAGPVTENSSI